MDGILFTVTPPAAALSLFKTRVSTELDTAMDASCLLRALAGSVMRDRASSTSRITPRKVDVYLPLS